MSKTITDLEQIDYANDTAYLPILQNGELKKITKANLLGAISKITASTLPNNAIIVKQGSTFKAMDLKEFVNGVLNLPLVEPVNDEIEKVACYDPVSGMYKGYTIAEFKTLLGI